MKNAKQARHWTAADRKSMAGYVTVLQEQLRLRDWDIKVNFDEEGSDDAYADITPHLNQKRAEIRFGDAFFELDPVGVRHTLVHELLHCHLFYVHDTAESVFRATIRTKAADIAAITLNAEVERATDAIADAMAPLVPLPDVLPGWSTMPAPVLTISKAARAARKPKVSSTAGKKP